MKLSRKIVESTKLTGTDCPVGTRGETGPEPQAEPDTRRVVWLPRAAREASTGSSTSAPLAMSAPPLCFLPPVLLHAVERSRFVTILLFCVLLWEIQRNWEKTFISVEFCFGLGCGIIFGFWKRVRDLRQIRETHSILRRFNTTSGGEMQPPGSRVEPCYGMQRYHRNCAICAFSVGVDGDHFACYGSKRCGDCGFLPFSTICGMGDHLASQYGMQSYHRNCAICAFSVGVDGDHFAYLGRQRWCGDCGFLPFFTGRDEDRGLGDFAFLCIFPICGFGRDCKDWVNLGFWREDDFSDQDALFRNRPRERVDGRKWQVLSLKKTWQIASLESADCASFVVCGLDSQMREWGAWLGASNASGPARAIMDELKEAISLGFQEMALRLQAMEPRRAEAQQPPEESNKVAVQRIEIHCTGCHQKSEEVDSTTQRPGSIGREWLHRSEENDSTQNRAAKAVNVCAGLKMTNSTKTRAAKAVDGCAG